MLTLGIETSCDETAAAVIKNGKEVISSCVSSSIHMHRKFGGIIPEIASRFHLEYINPVTEKALDEAGVTLKDIGLIAVTHTPGLLGSLLVGVCFAKAMSFASGIPLIGVNHIQAHLFAPFLEIRKFIFPFIGLVASGGHSSIALVKDFDAIEFIGQTRDDAAGEAFDKVAKIIDLGYPGGPAIDKASTRVTASPFRFNCARMEGSLDFSFSGIKTDVLYTWQKLKKKTPKAKAEIAFSFQKEVVNSLVHKSIGACKKHGIHTLSAGGGVACNQLLRKQLGEEAARENIRLLLAKKEFCLDNAAMIAVLGHHLYKKGLRSSTELNARATA